MAIPKKIQIKRNMDERGILDQVYNLDIPFEIKRSYTVKNFSPGTIRGLHKNFDEWKGFYIIKGSALFVVFKNDEFPQKFILSEITPEMLIVPPDYWNGWIDLGEDTILLAFSNIIFENHKEERMPVNSYYRKFFMVKSR